jgi:hypothetical protein
MSSSQCVITIQENSDEYYINEIMKFIENNQNMKQKLSEVKDEKIGMMKLTGISLNIIQNE